jgi:hypothetical protein
LICGSARTARSTIPADSEYPEETWGAKVIAVAGLWAGPPIRLKQKTAAPDTAPKQ